MAYSEAKLKSSGDRASPWYCFYSHKIFLNNLKMLFLEIVMLIFKLVEGIQE
jgi:hypothetical protein